MEQELINATKSLLLPPGGLILMALLGLMFSRHLIGTFLVLVSVACLYLFSTPFVAGKLMAELEIHPALGTETLENRQAEAIVVLGGGRYSGALEYGGDTIGPLLLERVRYAAWLHRRTGLPVIPSGGSGQQEGPSEAGLIRQVLERELGVQVIALEEKSRSTRQNAQLTAELLKRLHIQRILLVSHAWHLPRATAEFQKAGVDVIPAPTGFRGKPGPARGYEEWLPSIHAFTDSHFALHEYLGNLWYQIRE
jgi:uncharacterized SAM-binding protein YcdF (DUF218 family)